MKNFFTGVFVQIFFLIIAAGLLFIGVTTGWVGGILAVGQTYLLGAGANAS